ncbi:hypothetical protein HSB1_39910 [Halogranum salarium B-1]|uniref:Uncharacterized protein n=1 Tax=Halogranum salarium B-1 TaxID=1210908 RepID=J2ZAD5_9EURY|nr:hypothetical protein HSB1_39910 [Halogranum salarium B-1]
MTPVVLCEVGSTTAVGRDAFSISELNRSPVGFRYATTSVMS